MSYDIWLEVDLGGEYPKRITETWTPTYNLAEIFKEILGEPIRKLNGLSAEKIAEIINLGLARYDTPEKIEELRKLEPSNGWGTVENAFEFLKEVERECNTAPKAIFRV